MTPEQFAELAKAGFNRIPVYREVLADLDTPLSTYFKLASGPYSYLFESVQGGEKWGRYSIIGLPSREVLKVHDHTVTITRDDEVIEETTVDDPLAFVEDYQARFNAPVMMRTHWPVCTNPSKGLPAQAVPITRKSRAPDSGKSAPRRA